MCVERNLELTDVCPLLSVSALFSVVIIEIDTNSRGLIPRRFTTTSYETRKLNYFRLNSCEFDSRVDQKCSVHGHRRAIYNKPRSAMLYLGVLVYISFVNS